MNGRVKNEVFNLYLILPFNELIMGGGKGQKDISVPFCKHHTPYTSNGAVFSPAVNSETFVKL